MATPAEIRSIQILLSKAIKKIERSALEPVDRSWVSRALPRLFEELEITKNTQILIGPHSMKVELRNHIFQALTQETDTLKLTITTAGSPLASAIACALAKATGKPVTILSEETTPDQTTTIKYRISEE